MTERDAMGRAPAGQSADVPPERSDPDPLADTLADRTPRSPGRVSAAEAVTGDRPAGDGQSPPGGIPGDDSSLQGGDIG